LYTYVGNDPVNYVDPTGHIAEGVTTNHLLVFVGVVVAWWAVVMTTTMHRHHSWPKYLGGEPKQRLTNLPAPDHIGLHKEMDQFAPRWKGKDYYDGLSDTEKEQILEQLKKLYEANCPKCLADLLDQLGEGGGEADTPASKVEGGNEGADETPSDSHSPSGPQ
jgi:hypothetical protein